MLATPFATSAAFYDVDGTLIKTNIVHAFAYYALNQPSPVRSLLKGLQTAVSIPFFAAADKLSRKVFNQFFYQYYAGQPEDRLIVLAEDLFEEVIRPSIYPGAKDLVAESRRVGRLDGKVCRASLISTCACSVILARSSSTGSEPTLLVPKTTSTQGAFVVMRSRSF